MQSHFCKTRFFAGTKMHISCGIDVCISSLYETTPKANRAGLSAMKTFGKQTKLQDSVGITNFNFWMACLGYWKVTTNFILDRWRIQIQRPVQHCCSSTSRLRSFPICLLNKLFLLLLTLVTCIFTIWSWMASRIIIANMSVSNRIDWGRLALRLLFCIP